MQEQNSDNNTLKKMSNYWPSQTVNAIPKASGNSDLALIDIEAVVFVEIQMIPVMAVAFVASLCVYANLLTCCSTQLTFVYLCSKEWNNVQTQEEIRQIIALELVKIIYKETATSWCEQHLKQAITDIFKCSEEWRTQYLGKVFLSFQLYSCNKNHQRR